MKQIKFLPADEQVMKVEEFSKKYNISPERFKAHRI